MKLNPQMNTINTSISNRKLPVLKPIWASPISARSILASVYLLNVKGNPIKLKPSDSASYVEEISVITIKAAIANKVGFICMRINLNLICHGDPGFFNDN